MAIRVGILTSGGDCPGLNATIRGVAKALYHRMGSKVEIVGIMNGYDGLINGNYREMSPDEFSGILTVGGTILGTKRTPFKKMRVVEEDKVDKVAAMKKNYRAAKLDCLLCLGGNGTHKTANLYKQMPFGNPAYHELFRLLEEHRVPLLFHCTCGKDRTGIAAMLVLLALGVSREDAIADYMLTNVYRKAIIDKFMQDKPADQYDLLLPVEGVSKSMGAGSIDVLLEKYPSYEAYFEAEYGLTTARLAALRDFYLE